MGACASRPTSFCAATQMAKAMDSVSLAFQLLQVFVVG
jgi:hypothetical protein